MVAPLPSALLAEDDLGHALLGARACREVGLAPVVLERCGDALAYLGGRGPYADRGRHPLPTLVLADVLGSSGGELFAWARANPGGPPAVLVSCYGEELGAAKARELGAAAYLEKPLTPRALRGLAARLGLELPQEGSPLRRARAAASSTIGRG